MSHVTGVGVDAGAVLSAVTGAFVPALFDASAADESALDAADAVARPVAAWELATVVATARPPPVAALTARTAAAALACALTTVVRVDKLMTSGTSETGGVPAIDQRAQLFIDTTRRVITNELVSARAGATSA